MFYELPAAACGKEIFGCTECAKKQLPEAEQKRFSISCEVRVVSGAVKQRLP